MYGKYNLLAVSDTWRDSVCTMLCCCVLSSLRVVIDIARDHVISRGNHLGSC